MACTLWIVLSYWKLQKEKKWSDQLRSIAVTGIFWNYLLSFNMQCSFPDQECRDLTQVFCSIQVAIQQLRDRLTRALGQQGSAPGASVQTQRAPSQLPAPRAQLRHPYTQVHPTMVPQPTPAAPVPMPTSASAPAQPQYYQPVCSAELPLHLITVFTHRSDFLGSYLSIIYSDLHLLWFYWQFFYTNV